MAFVGSHLDVVPANPETWERNPFKLVVEVGEWQSCDCCRIYLREWLVVKIVTMQVTIIIEN